MINIKVRIPVILFFHIRRDSVQNCDMGLPVSTYHLLLDVLCDAKKSLFLDAFPMDPQIEQIEPWSAKGKKEHPEEFQDSNNGPGRGGGGGHGGHVIILSYIKLIKLYKIKI